MIGCKPLCFFGEVPPWYERTKKKPYTGGDRAGTACRQTDTEEEPGKLAERTSQSLVCQVVRRKSAEIAALCAGQGRQPCPVDVMPCVISYWVLSGAFIWSRKAEYFRPTSRRSLWFSSKPQQHGLLPIPCRPQSQHESGLSVSLFWLWSGWRCNRLYRKIVSAVLAASGGKAGLRFWAFCNRHFSTDTL